MSKIELLKSISDGANDSYFCRFNGKPAFVKYYLKNPLNTTVNFLKKVDSKIHEHFRDNVGPLSYRSQDMFHSHTDKEVFTYQLWEKEGILVPEIFEYDEEHIVLNLLNGDSVGSITKREFNLGILEQTIDMFDKTRKLGREKNDTVYFHSDPHLDNFMYLDDADCVIPIDSSLKVRSDMKIGRIDALINLYFAYNLLDRVSSYSSCEIKSVFDSYKSTLKSSDVKFLQKNSKPNRIYDIYSVLREEVAYRVRKRDKIDTCRIYGKQRSEELSDLLN